VLGFAVPAVQLVHDAWPVTFWYEPTGHAKQLCPGVGLYSPTLHATHDKTLVAPVPLYDVPAGQGVHASTPVHAVAYVLEGQVRHDVDPLTEKVPAGQQVHCVTELAPYSFRKVPAGQSVHPASSELLAAIAGQLMQARVGLYLPGVQREQEL
jgi:hypothetical protein